MAGSNNFLTFDENKINMISDANYLTNTQRQNGGATGIMPKEPFNKALYQASIMAAAWGQVFSNLGFAVSDGDFNSLVTVLSNVFTKGGGNLSGGINETSVTLASAATVSIGAAAGNFIEVTGTNNISAFDVAQKGTKRTLRFAGILTLVHSANLVLPGAANIVTAAGDFVEFESLGAGTWVCSNFSPIGGLARLAGSTTQAFQAADGASGKQVVNISQLGASLAESGYQRLPSGLIQQWGTATIPGPASVTVTLPISFPTAAFAAVATGVLVNQYVCITNINAVSIQLDNSSSSVALNVYWFIIGH
jgi:hypothetical protein